MAWDRNYFLKRLRESMAGGWPQAFYNRNKAESAGQSIALALEDTIVEASSLADPEVPSLVFNGSFEQVRGGADWHLSPPLGWTPVSGASGVGTEVSWAPNFTYASAGGSLTHQTGSRAVTFTPTATGESGIISDRFPVEDSATYEGGFTVRPGLGGGSINIQCYVHWFDQNDTYISRSGLGDSTYTAEVWKTVRAFVTAPANARWARIYPAHGNCPTSASFNLDRVWLRKSRLIETGTSYPTGLTSGDTNTRFRYRTDRDHLGAWDGTDSVWKDMAAQPAWRCEFLANQLNVGAAARKVDLNTTAYAYDVSVDLVNNYVTLTHAGVYLIGCHIQVSGMADADPLTVFIGNSAAASIQALSYSINRGTASNLSPSAMIHLNAGQTVSICTQISAAADIVAGSFYGVRMPTRFGGFT